MRLIAYSQLVVFGKRLAEYAPKSEMRVRRRLEIASRR
jgi:hypothetical protein